MINVWIPHAKDLELVEEVTPYTHVVGVGLLLLLLWSLSRKCNEAREHSRQTPQVRAAARVDRLRSLANDLGVPTSALNPHLRRRRARPAGPHRTRAGGPDGTEEYLPPTRLTTPVVLRTSYADEIRQAIINARVEAAGAARSASPPHPPVVRSRTPAATGIAPAPGGRLRFPWSAAAARFLRRSKRGRRMDSEAPMAVASAAARAAHRSPCAACGGVASGPVQQDRGSGSDVADVRRFLKRLEEQARTTGEDYYTSSLRKMWIDFGIELGVVMGNAVLAAETLLTWFYPTWKTIVMRLCVNLTMVLLLAWRSYMDLQKETVIEWNLWLNLVRLADGIELALTNPDATYEELKAFALECMAHWDSLMKDNSLNGDSSLSGGPNF